MDREPLIHDIVREVGRSHNKSDEEIQQIIDTFNENWISSLSQWLGMSAEERKLLNLPVLLEQEIEDWKPRSSTENSSSHQSLSSTEEEQLDQSFCYIFYNSCKLMCSINNAVYEFDAEAPLKTFLSALGDGAYVKTKDNLIVHPSTKIIHSLVSGRYIFTSTKKYIILKTCSFKAVDQWLKDMNLHKYSKSFYVHNIDDFLLLPFLRQNDLDEFDIAACDKRKILEAATLLQGLEDHALVGQWVGYLGFQEYSSYFVENKIGIELLPRLKEADLIKMGVKEEDKPVLFEIIKQYAEFSSVEATYLWLDQKGFHDYAFQFVRYNIPFYALPLVNFFIVNEMGFTKHNQLLLTALIELKNSPDYNLKAMAYWLRDLEVEKYTILFAKNLLVNFIESLTILTDVTLARLIPSHEDRDKIKRAVQDMKEFQLYYSTTASLLHEIVLEKYASIFAGTSSMDLPMLTEEKLHEVGITDENDCQQILACIKKMKEDLPNGIGNNNILNLQHSLMNMNGDYRSSAEMEIVEARKSYLLNNNSSKTSKKLKHKLRRR